MEDDSVQCPYFPDHIVPYSRMPYHLIKCKVHYKGPPLDTCKYNATHLVPKGTLDEHYKTCIAVFHATLTMEERRLNQRKHF